MKVAFSSVTLLALVTYTHPASAELIMGVSGFDSPILLSVDTSDGSNSPIGSAEIPNRFNSLAMDQSGMIYSIGTVNFVDDQLATFDPLTGVTTAVATVDFGPGVDVDVRGLSFSPGGTLYAMQATIGGDDLYSVNIGTGEGTLVGSLNFGSYQSIAFAPDGTLYSWDGAGFGSRQGLVTIDTATGEATDVSAADDGTNLIFQGMVFSNNVLYSATQTEFYQIDLATGIPTQIGPNNVFNDMRGLAAPLASTPEPSSLALMSLMAPYIPIRKRRQRHSRSA